MVIPEGTVITKKENDKDITLVTDEWLQKLYSY